jgi:GT2 family glycosyltransferase
LQSLVEQDLDRFDTVLVDDASEDGSADLLDGLAELLSAKGSVMVLRHDRNVGQAATLNEAISTASTPLVTVLNDDDWLTPGMLTAALDVLREHPEVVLVGAGSMWFEGAGRPPEVPPGPPYGVRKFTSTEVRAFRHPNDLNMTHSGMTMRRAAWQVVGGYRRSVADRLVPFSDRDLQLRVAALYPVAVIDAPLVWWRSDSSVDAGVNS